MRPAIEAALVDAAKRLETLDLGDRFEAAAAQAIVASGLHRLCVPAAVGGFEATMVEAAHGELVLRRRVDVADPRGPGPGWWFGMSIAATYLGVGEGARRDIVAWAIDRRPGDGRTAVADVPSVRLRLGRLDAELRSARIVVLDAARRFDDLGDGSDVPLAKLVATRAAVSATDEALRIAGGPGFLAGRLERAFRDARAGLINPPLEDVALTGFGAALIDQVRADESDGD